MSISGDDCRLVGSDISSSVATGMLRERLAVYRNVGCDPRVCSQPVDLEPAFPHDADSPTPMPSAHDARLIQTTSIRRIWCPKEFPLSWPHHNDLYKELTVVNKPVAFEIIGNGNRLWVQYAADVTDAAPLETALQAEFPKAELDPTDQDVLADWLRRDELYLDIEDYFPYSPFFKSMTVHDGIGGSPLAPVYVAESQLSPSEFACYRVLFVPASRDPDWHARITTLADADYRGTQDDYFNPSVPSYHHQLPSQYLPKLSEKEERKAHPDKPFFAVNVMALALSPVQGRPMEILRTMRTAMSNFLYGSHPLRFQRKTPYLECFNSDLTFRVMLAQRTPHRCGMILNSTELSVLAHLPPGGILDGEGTPLRRIEGFEVHESLKSGNIRVGTNHHIGQDVPVYIPGNLANENVYVIGRPGSGKSCELNATSSQEIAAGRGCAFIDFTGDEWRKVVGHIPDAREADTIVMQFTIPGYTACFNPFDVGQHADRSRIADEIATAFLAGVESKGARMENIIRQSCYALLHVPGATFNDVGRILAQTPEGDRFRHDIVPLLRSVDARRFWTHLFPKYKADALDPITNKMSRLMLHERTASVLSQPHGRIRFRDVMDHRKILIVDLSGLGTANANFIGSLIVGQFKEAAYSRADTLPAERIPFSLYIDEFHRVTTTSMEELLTQCRKYRVAVRLAHQETGQLDYQTRRAVGTADTVIAFSVDVEDASRIARELLKEVEEEDLIRLGVGRAYARINNHVVDIHTCEPLPEPDEAKIRRIVERSIRDYYIQDTEVPTPGVRTDRVVGKPRVFETFRTQ